MGWKVTHPTFYHSFLLVSLYRVTNLATGRHYTPGSRDSRRSRRPCLRSGTLVSHLCWRSRAELHRTRRASRRMPWRSCQQRLRFEHDSRWRHGNEGSSPRLPEALSHDTWPLNTMRHFDCVIKPVKAMNPYANNSKICLRLSLYIKFCLFSISHGV